MNDRPSYSPTKSSSSSIRPRKTSSSSSSKLSNPIDIPSRSRQANSSSPTSYTHTDKTPNLSTSPTQMTPPFSPTPHHYSSCGKRASSSSYSTTTTSHPHVRSRANQHSRASDDYRRYSGTVNHCGRHSNDWLFGGFSVRDTVRDGVDRWKQHRYDHHLQHEQERARYHQQDGFERGA